MNREIIIDIDEANKALKFKDDALLQLDAYEKVYNILRTYKSELEIRQITNCRTHDTIFIDGARGAGKTAFMLNIENYYNKKILDSNKDENKFTFFDSIDPTLLEHSEKFLSVVLARIVEKTNYQIQNMNVNKEKLDNYFNSLEELSKSLSAIKTLSSDIGLEEIASNKSSLKLEQHAHEFFRSVTDIFDSNVLVILIDDVDMAFEKGFDVLEVVRKYLASPFIIPIVAGDIKLYKEIIETQFMEKINFNPDINTLKNLETSGFENFDIVEKVYNEKRHLLNNLVEQYLHKVFPNYNHIQLKTIFEILKKDIILFEFKGNKEKFQVSYNDIKDFEIRHINFGVNQVDFTYRVFTNNTRELFQYITNKKDIYIEFFDNIDREKLKKSVDIRYDPRRVSEKFDNDIYKIILNTTFYKDSLEKTGEFYFSSYERKKKELSNLTFNDYNSFENNNFNLYNAFKSSFFQDLKKLKLDQSNDYYAFQSENLNNLLNEKNSEDQYSEISNYIIELFTFSDYYSSYQKRNYLTVGKFIENMIFSFDKIIFDTSIWNIDWTEKIHKLIDEYLKDKNSFNDFDALFDLNVEVYNILFENKLEDNLNLDDVLIKVHKDVNDFKKNKLERNENLITSLSSIAYKIPFGSDFTKTKARYKEESIDLEELEEYNFGGKHDLEEYSYNLLLWQNIFLRKTHLNSISLYEILLKFFRNLEKIKELKLKDDRPIDFIRRIVLTFINSVAFFENPNENISNTNYAMSENFKLNNILSKTPASFKNIYPMFKEKFSLTRALFFHPLISHILFTDEKEEGVTFDSKLIKLEWQGRKINKIEVSSRTLIRRKMSNIYSKYFIENKEDKNEVKSKNKLTTEDVYNYLKTMNDLRNKLSDIDREILLKLLNNKTSKFYKAQVLIEKNKFILNSVTLATFINYKKIVNKKL